MHIDHDVTITGLGPVGATLAILLAQQGLSVGIYEREAAPYPLPRAVHIDGEVMRVFQQVGIAETIEPSLFVNIGMRFVDADQQLLIDWPRPGGIGPQGWHTSYRLHQPDLEQALGAMLNNFPAISVWRNIELGQIEQLEDGITATLRDRLTGETFKRRSAFLVGCDGARSFVRQWIGGGLIDLESNAQWLVVDVIMRYPVSTLSDWTFQLCDPVRPTTIARGTGTRRRWEFMIMPGDDLEQLTDPQFVWSLLSRWIGPDDADIERTAVYNFNAVIAETWRDGRVLIAGDAAHRTPPFLGQGLCAGVRDASNLAWKIATVHRGGGEEERLLASYQSEREPHVREFVAQAVRVGEVLQADAATAAVYKTRFTAQGTEQMQTPAPSLGHGLHDPGDLLGGQIAPQPRLDTGTRLDDLVGNDWLLLVRPDLVGKFESVSIGVGVRVQADPDASLERLPGADKAVAVLVRPDRYILASALSEEQALDLPKLFLSIVGELQPEVQS